MEQKKSEEKKVKRYCVAINPKLCKSCGICTAFCSKGVFVADDFGKPTAKYSEKCINCRLCVVRCPDFAIKVYEEGNENTDKNK